MEDTINGVRRALSEMHVKASNDNTFVQTTVAILVGSLSDLASLVVSSSLNQKAVRPTRDLYSAFNDKNPERTLWQNETMCPDAADRSDF